VRALAAILFWILIVFFVFFIDPGFMRAIPTFLILLFSFLVFFVSVLTNNLRQILVYSFVFILFFVLGYFGLGNLLNLLLLIGILVTCEIYFRPR
jgi:hypothetical protein